MNFGLKKLRKFQKKFKKLCIIKMYFELIKGFKY